MRRPAVLHQALAAGVRAFNRLPGPSNRLALLPMGDYPFYSTDGLWTNHSHAFVDDERFRRAHDRAVKAGGHDYRIPWRVHTILWAASLAASARGAFVECGTGRGYMASAICQYLGWTDRPFYLYDTFSPFKVDLDGTRTTEVSSCYAKSVEDVRRNFAEWPGARLVVGELPDTLSDEPEEVAFLHVDLNAAAPERTVVRHFWPRLTPGAVLVFDDYGFPAYEASRRMADELGRELGFSILSVPTGQGLVVRPGIGS